MKTMKSTMARLFALCLTVAMVLSMATMGAFAFGSPVNDKDQTGTITISGMVHDAGANVSLYQVIDVNMYQVDENMAQPKDPMYTWNSAVSSWVSSKYPDYIDTQKSNAVTKKFAEASSANLSKFYADLAKAIEDKTITIDATTGTLDNENYSCTFEMAMGQYLVIANKTSYVYSPATANLFPQWGDNDADDIDSDMTLDTWYLNDVTVFLKSKGGIDKNVEGENGDNSDLGYAVGDTVTYRLDVAIPVYPEPGPDEEIIHKRFEVGDTMGKGLTFSGLKDGEGNDLVKVYANTDPDSYDKDNDLVPMGSGENANYTITEVANGFAIEFKYDKLKATVGTDTYVHVVYTATLNEDAFEKDALGNEAYLGVNTDPYDNDSYEKTTVKKKVYTYGINVDKVDIEKPDTSLKGAEFKLYKKEMVKDEETGEEKEVEKAVAFTYDEAKKVYIKTTDAVGTVEATTLVTDGEGEIQLQGLDCGTYYLKEIKAPGGYQLPADPTTTIVMKDEQKGTERGQDGNLDNSSVKGSMVIGSTQVSKNIISFKLGNAKPGFELPTTGGMGTVLFTAGGLVIMACGAALVLVTLKKKKAED